VELQTEPAARPIAADRRPAGSTRADEPRVAPGRRRLLRTLAGAGVAAVAGTVGLAGTGLGSAPAGATPRWAVRTDRTVRTDQTDPATRRVVLVGANPAVQLFDGEIVTAYASAWRVDWSPFGRGTALVLWHDGRVHVYGADTRLARWLEREFVRFFPEVAELPWPEPTVARRPVHLANNLATGMEARAGDVHIQMSDVVDRRTFATDDFPLGGIPHSLSLVLAPCSQAAVSIRGRRVPGEIKLGGTPERPGSSAFTTEAEVWKR
jgi:hypothetical protein